MTRIVIFCDGTWNSPIIAEPTHVVKLSQSLLSDPSQGQVVAYFAGIGTDRRFDGPIAKFFNKYGGGAFGWGLDVKVKQAYQFIAQAYRPGDEIYLFGFSRGAYTARSVAGMIRKCGIVQDTSPAGINAAYLLYRRRGPRNRPDAPQIQAERRSLSPRFATSADDLSTRGGAGHVVQIAYVGVWDTVGARGIPNLLGPVAALWNLRYRFHDTELSSLVQRARHALALDERRRLYPPAAWDNLDGEDGLNAGDTGPDRPYQQLWFCGAHGTVGGSSAEQSLAAITLDWVYAGVPELTLKTGATIPPTPMDPAAPLAPSKPGPLARWLTGWRDGPQREHDLHGSVRERLDKLPDYRPGSLKAILKRTGLRS